MRVTPACAGKSKHSKHNICFHQGHPRVCGEKSSLFMVSLIARGSPPRVRGKGRKSALLSVYHGVTPACAGKRLKKTLKIAFMLLKFFNKFFNKPDEFFFCHNRSGFFYSIKHSKHNCCFHIITSDIHYSISY